MKIFFSWKLKMLNTLVRLFQFHVVIQRIRMLGTLSVKVVQTHNKNPVSLHRTRTHKIQSTFNIFINIIYIFCPLGECWVEHTICIVCMRYLLLVCMCLLFKKFQHRVRLFPFNLIRMKRMHWMKLFIKANMRTEFDIWFAAIQLGMNSYCYWIAMFFFGF